MRTPSRRAPTLTPVRTATVTAAPDPQPGAVADTRVLRTGRTLNDDVPSLPRTPLRTRTGDEDGSVTAYRSTARPAVPRTRTPTADPADETDAETWVDGAAQPGVEGGGGTGGEDVGGTGGADDGGTGGAVVGGTGPVDGGAGGTDTGGTDAGGLDGGGVDAAGPGGAADEVQAVLPASTAAPLAAAKRQS